MKTIAGGKRSATTGQSARDQLIPEGSQKRLAPQQRLLCDPFGIDPRFELVILWWRSAYHRLLSRIPFGMAKIRAFMNVNYRTTNKFRPIPSRLIRRTLRHSYREHPTASALPESA